MHASNAYEIAALKKEQKNGLPDEDHFFTLDHLLNATLKSDDPAYPGQTLHDVMPAVAHRAPVNQPIAAA